MPKMSALKARFIARTSSIDPHDWGALSALVYTAL